MKYADINCRFTEIVAEWLAKGYSINTASMSGSQGETAKIDLTDGKEIVRILVDRFSDYAANVEGVEMPMSAPTTTTTGRRSGTTGSKSSSRNGFSKSVKTA